MSRLSITVRSVQRVRLSPEGDNIGVYFHFPRQISFGQRRRQKREDKEEMGNTGGGRIQVISNLRSLGVSFSTFYRLCPCSLAHSSPLCSFPPPFLSRDPTLRQREAHNNNRNTIFIWHMPSGKSLINKKFISSKRKKMFGKLLFTVSLVTFLK